MGGNMKLEFGIAAKYFIFIMKKLKVSLRHLFQISIVEYKSPCILFCSIFSNIVTYAKG